MLPILPDSVVTLEYVQHALDNDLGGYYCLLSELPTICDPLSLHCDFK